MPYGHPKIATANVRDTLPNPAALASLRVVLSMQPWVTGLEEWVSTRSTILTQIAQQGRYLHARPSTGGGPVVYDSTRVRLDDCHTVTIAPRQNVGELNGRRTILPPSRVSVFDFTELGTSKPLRVGIMHLTAEVQLGREYRRDAAHAKRVERHKREREGVEAIAQEHPHHTFIVGDTNFAGMPLPPLVSCWEGNPGRAGTLGNRIVDYVYGSTLAVDVRALRTRSDHRAVVAQY